MQHTNETDRSLGRGNRFLKLSPAGNTFLTPAIIPVFFSGGENSSAVDFAQKITPLNVIEWNYAEELNFKLLLVMSGVTALKA
jgi:hypothetical protein